MKPNTASLRIVSELRANIRSGALKPGARMPSTRALMKTHGVALATAAKVMAMLKKEGLVRVEPGVGTLVRGSERQPELGLERIVEQAISIADEEGTAVLTMRLLARELGVSTMALYRYVSSREELLFKMTETVLLETPLPKIDRSPWRPQIETYARLIWNGCQRHPWLVRQLSIARPQVMPKGMQHTEHVLQLFALLRIPEPKLFRLAVSFMAMILGLAGSIEDERHAEQDTGMNNDEWMKLQEPRFEDAVARFPMLTRMSKVETLEMSLDDLFEEALATFLNGLALPKGRGKL